MAEPKTKLTNKSPRVFLKSIAEPDRRKEAQALLEIFKAATSLPPKMWGEHIVGFGQYHYESKRSAQKGNWPLTGFSPRKQNFSLYIMPGFAAYEDLLAKLGKHTTSKGCLYIKRLGDVDEKVLEKLIKRSVADMRKRHHVDS